MIDRDLDPTPADIAIYQKGQAVAAICTAKAQDAEDWVRAVAKKARAQVDWHYSGGSAQVLHLGDAESRLRVEAAIDELEFTLEGRVLKRFKPDDPGLYRDGVTTAPDGAIVSCLLPGGEAVIILAE